MAGCCRFASASEGGAVEPASPAVPSLFANRVELSLPAYLQQVLEYNESIQARLVAFHAARAQRRAEQGTFEPTLVTSTEWVDRERPNTIEIERSLRSGGVFKEQNLAYSSAIEVRTPYGSRVRLGGGARRLTNNIQRTVIVDIEAEYESSVGLTIDHPLLKNSGRAATMAAMRLAARNSESVFQDYRRQLMLVVAEAELAYRDLYFAQEGYRLSVESVGLAQSVLADNRARADAGRGSRLDVLEAEAGLAMRLAHQGEARQVLVEALNQMAAYFSESPQQNQTQYVAIEAPQARPVELSFEDSSKSAESMNANLLIARSQIEQEQVRLAYARNQRLPQLDLRASVGAAGLGFNWDTSLDDIEHTRFPAWTVGLEMRLPLMGGLRERNDLTVARNRLLQAKLSAADVETRVTTALDAALSRVQSTLASTEAYRSVVDFRQNLLDDQMKAVVIGRVETRVVLESEQLLFRARLEQMQSEVDHQRALLEMEMLQGTLLQQRGIEVGFEDLEKKTAGWLEEYNARLELLRYQAAEYQRQPDAEPVTFTGDALEGAPNAAAEPTPPKKFPKRHK